jgi:hypothetical protein
LLCGPGGASLLNVSTGSLSLALLPKRAVSACCWPPAPSREHDEGLAAWLGTADGSLLALRGTSIVSTTVVRAGEKLKQK